MAYLSRWNVVIVSQGHTEKKRYYIQMNYVVEMEGNKKNNNYMHVCRYLDKQEVTT